MVGQGEYTVASTAQLLGMKPSKGPDKAKPAPGPSSLTSDTKANQPISGKPEILKAVRFTPSTIAHKTVKHTPGGLRRTASTRNLPANQRAGSSTHVLFGALDETLTKDCNPHVSSHIEVTRSLDKSAKLNGRRDLVPTAVQETKAAGSQTAVEAALASSHGQQSNLSSRGMGSAKPIEIYFTPLEVDSRSTCLSSPVIGAQVESQTAQVVEQQTVRSLGRRPPNSPSVGEPGEQLVLTPAQLDQLVHALAKSPLIRSQVQRHWWNGVPDGFTDNADASDNCLDSLTSTQTFYSQQNTQFIIDSEDAVSLLNSNRSTMQLRKDHPSSPLTSTSIAIIDPHVCSSPIRYISSSFQSGHVGVCTALNMPYGSNLETFLRVGSCQSDPEGTSQAEVVLQVVSRLVDRRTGRRRHLLLAEVDMTADMQAAAIAELAAIEGRPVTEITISPAPSTCASPPSPSSPSSASSAALSLCGDDNTSGQAAAAAAGREHAHAFRSEAFSNGSGGRRANSDSDADGVDWLALADSLQRQAELADAVDSAAERLASLAAACAPSSPAAAVTPATQAVLARFVQQRAAHARCWVMRPGSQHYKNGVPTSVGVPWMSDAAYVETKGHDGNGAEADETLMALAAKAAGAGRLQDEFVDEIGGEKSKFVPVFDRDGGEREVVAWVCFLCGDV